MIHYRDMTFCSARCSNYNCPRNYTDDVHLAARAWGGEHPIVAFSDFSKTCEEYKEVGK